MDIEVLLDYNKRCWPSWFLCDARENRITKMDESTVVCFWCNEEESIQEDNLFRRDSGEAESWLTDHVRQGLRCWWTISSRPWWIFIADVLKKFGSNDPKQLLLKTILTGRSFQFLLTIRWSNFPLSRTASWHGLYCCCCINSTPVMLRIIPTRHEAL